MLYAFMRYVRCQAAAGRRIVLVVRARTQPERIPDAGKDADLMALRLSDDSPANRTLALVFDELVNDTCCVLLFGLK